MDFAFCPACKQSVLDDDAVNCPFCGAPMKGTPGAAKPGTVKAAAAAPAPSTAAAKPAPGKAAVKPAAPTDDSPFDITEDLTSTAIPAATAKSKRRTLQVKCPMCETVGYVPPEAAGKSVKCANPKCLVPVFTAPAPEPEKPPPPPPTKPKRNIFVVAGATVAVMAVGGAVAWFVAGLPKNVALKGPSPEDMELIKGLGQQSSTTPSDVPSKDSKSSPDQKPADETATAAVSPEIWRAGILKMMNDAALQPRQNRSKPFCRRLASEAFAVAGDLKGAQEQLDALNKVGKEVPFYQVMPLVEIARLQLAQGDRKGAAKSIDQAWKGAQSLPKTGRDRLETAIALAALLIANRRDGDAKTLLETHQATDAVARLAAARRAVFTFETFDLSEVYDRRPSLPWRSPLIVGVVYELVGRGQADAARKWASTLASERDQTEALAAWGEGLVWKSALTGSSVEIEAVRSTVESLPSPGDILALSRLGLSLALAGKMGLAGECLDRAAERLSQQKLFKEEKLPENVAELAKFTPREAEPRRFLASAAAETARLAAQIGRKDQAETLLQTALSQLRSLAPNPLSIRQRLKSLDSVTATNALREELRQALKLRNKDEAIVAANAFKKNLDDLAEAAEQRVELQRQILAEAIEWGLPDAVWSYIRRGSKEEDAAEADNLIYTNLSALLAETYAVAGRNDRYELVVGAWKQLVPDRPLPKSTPRTIIGESIRSGKTEDFQRAVEVVKSLKITPAEQDIVAQMAVCRATAEKQDAPALAFAARLNDAVLKEECYMLVAAMAARRGETQAAERHLTDVDQASEKVALGRGLVAGQVARLKSSRAGKNPEIKE